MNQMQRGLKADPIGALALATDTGELAATRAQQEAWFISHFDGVDGLTCVHSVTLRLCGRLDAPALCVALQELVDRHPVLRTTFKAGGNSLSLAEHGVLELASQDLSGDTARARDAAVARAVAAAVEAPFDLMKGPLFRGRLLRLGAEHALLVLAMHRAAGDRRVLHNLVAELAVLYACQLGHRDTVLHAASVLREMPVETAPSSERIAAAAQALAAVPPLDLPCDRMRPAQPQRRAGYCECALTVSRAAVEKLAAAHDCDVLDVLLAVQALWLQRLSAQRELVIALADAQIGLTPRAVTPHLPVPLRIDPEQSFSELLSAVQAQRKEALAGASLTEVMQAQGKDAPLPASVAFSVEQALDASTLGFPGLAAELSCNPRQHELFELSCSVVVGADTFAIECHYQAALFESATVAHWLDVYDALLASALAQPQAPMRGLSALSAAARRALEALQPAPCELPANGFVHAQIDAVCAQRTAHTAQITQDGELSYGELATWSNRIAHELIARGVEPGDRVGLCLARGGDLLPALLAVLKAGAAYVPLDPAFPAERLAFMAADSGLRLVVTQGGLARQCGLAALPQLELDQDRAGLLQRPSQPLPPLRGDPRSTAAYVIYTSGSTGTPKGVVLPHAAVSNFLESMRTEPGLRASDRIVAVTTLSFDIAVLELLLPLWVGATTVIASREQAGDGRLLRDLILANDVNVMQATPATWRLLLEAGFTPPQGFVALCGGEALPLDLAEQLRQQCAALWNMYGPTETTVWSTTWKVAPRARGIAIGRPIRNTRVYVLDEAGQPCPFGVPGEICIGGEGVALGYHERPALTAQRFVRDLFSTVPGARMYRTGDRGRWCSDGVLEHLGRLDHQVKLRGYRIELGEIEARLAALDAVARCLVMVREDRPGDARLVAYVVVQDGHSLELREVRRELRRFLPDYMIPQHFVTLHELPRLPNGKIDRSALPAPIAEAASSRPVEPLAPAQTPLLHCVAKEMAELLGVPLPGADDDFFALGGHSLLAAQLALRLRAATGRAASLRMVFDAPTPAQLAARLQTAPSSESLLIPPVGASEAPLLANQARLWVLQSLDAGSPAYNSPSLHGLRGPLDVEALERAFQCLLRRQGVLRTRLRHNERGGLTQVVQPMPASGTAPLVSLLPFEDLSTLPAAEREAELQQRIEAQIKTPILLNDQLLYRVRLYRLDTEQHVLLLVAHQIILDSASIDILTQELAALYAAECSHEPAALPPLPVSFADYSLWHARWLKSEAYRAQRDHWRRLLTQRSAPQLLPGDRPWQAEASIPLPQTEWLDLPASLHADLEALARKRRTTVFAIGLTAFASLVARRCAQCEVTIGVPVRSREHAELEHVMGMFTTVLPMALTIDPDQDFARALESTNNVVVDALAHPDVALDDLLTDRVAKANNVPRLYQALFSFEDLRGRPQCWGALQHTQIPRAEQGTSEDFGLWLALDHGRMHGGVLYNPARHEAGSAQVFAAQFVALLQAVAARPEAPLRELLRPSPFEAALLDRWENEQGVRVVDGQGGRCGIGVGGAVVRLGDAASERFPDGVPDCGRWRHDGALEACAEQPPPQTPRPAPNAAATRRLPRSPLQHLLYSLWRDALGHDDFGIDDDFFDLGGYSLLAARMFQEAERRTGVDLPLATLYRAPTIARLAAEYALAGARISDDAETTEQISTAEAWRPLVPIREGSGRPLFLIHAVGGNVVNYRGLAAQLPEDLPVYGLQAVGLDGISAPSESVEAMAERYVAEIRRQQPQGPYRVGGGSMGGVIAYEVARRLRLCGEQVELLAMFDSLLPACARSTPLGRLGGALRQAPVALPQRLTASLRMRVRNLGDHLSVGLHRLLRRPLPHALRFRHIERVHRRAYFRYRPGAFDAQVTLFVAKQGWRLSQTDPTLGWGSVVGDRVRVIPVAGTHENLIGQRSLADALCSVLGELTTGEVG